MIFSTTEKRTHLQRSNLQQNSDNTEGSGTTNVEQTFSRRM